MSFCRGDSVIVTFNSLGQPLQGYPDYSGPVWYHQLGVQGVVLSVQETTAHDGDRVQVALVHPHTATPMVAWMWATRLALATKETPPAIKLCRGASGL